MSNQLTAGEREIVHLKLLSLANLVEILAVRHVKQGMEAKGFRAVQSLVQPLH